MKRFLLLLSICFSLGIARADESSAWVKAGMEGLNAQTTIYIDLAGTSTLGSVISGLRTVVLYKRDVDSDNKIRERLECADYVDGVLVQRIVGDGTSLWTYDPKSNTYSVQVYGSYTKVQDENYSRKLFQGFMSYAKGQGAIYLARLMLDSKGYDTVKYTPWIPSATSEVTDMTSFVRVRYLDGDPPKRILSFVTNRETDGTYKLSSLGYWDLSMVGSKQRSSHWLANISTNATIDDSHFVFTPPAGSNPVVKS